MASSTFTRMPDEVRELGSEWKSLVGQIPGLTTELEREFRFGRRISKTERGYILGGTIKGGSSSVWYPATKDDFDAYQLWSDREGLLRPGREDAGALLSKLLDSAGIDLVHAREGALTSQRLSLWYTYELMHAVLARLPEKHLSQPALSRIIIGGWGPDGAKASAYHNGAVMLYDFALQGARRTFLGLLLHEVGHAHEHALLPALRERLVEAYRGVCQYDAFFTVEFLLDSSSRKFYQRAVIEEFLAETYLVYAACGGPLRAYIDGLPGPARSVWRAAYETFRESFQGMEYE